MRLENLSDNELVDYVIKHDNDPIRVRLATHMQRVQGAIMDDLIDAGMDDVWCTFENTYHPGQYIRHLENEIEYLNEQHTQDLKELNDLKARTVMDLIAELKQEIKTAEWSMKEAYRERNVAVEEREKMKHKLDMWAVLNR
jgi:hypothetical protein